MSSLTFEMIRLQGELRVQFMQQGVSEEKSLDLASEALHFFMVSPLAKAAYAEEYKAGLGDAEPEEAR